MSGNTENTNGAENTGTGARSDSGRNRTLNSSQINTLLTDLGNVLREVSRNNRRDEECCMDFEIDKLTELSKQSCELFISQYKRLNETQRKRVNLNVKMDMMLFKHLKRLNVTKSNNVLIKHLQEIVDEEKMKDLKAPD
eukprot:augustus_masked-scaffold_26-processed-gene-4.24-mRNA-1 protein AED:1.00 eAED:1.00 QI:0/-1/0/0/-1/1/1/0/138